jgi:hypothetical protein
MVGFDGLDEGFDVIVRGTLLFLPFAGIHAFPVPATPCDTDSTFVPLAGATEIEISDDERDDVVEEVLSTVFVCWERAAVRTHTHTTAALVIAVIFLAFGVNVIFFMINPPNFQYKIIASTCQSLYIFVQ